MAFTHGTQNCFEAATTVTLNHDCAGSSTYINNTGDYDLSLSYTNNGTTTEISIAAGADQTVDLGWAEGSTNTISYFGSYPNEPDNPPSIIQLTFSDKVVNCQPPTVQLEEGDDSYTFTLTPPCAVNDYGIIPIDTDPDTPGTQITDEFTWSITLLPNGNLEITVDDVDDIDIDGTTLDAIKIFWTGPDCVEEDCEPAMAGMCQIDITIEVLDNDSPEEIAATGTAHVRMIGLSILIAMLGYGFLHLAQLYGPALLVRVVEYRKIRNTVRVEGSRKAFIVWKKVRKD